jgi:glutamate 5-kinase
MKDDVVWIADEKGNPLGVGKTAYSSEEAGQIIGKKGEKPIIHYDYLYLL